MSGGVWRAPRGQVRGRAESLTRLRASVRAVRARPATARGIGRRRPVLSLRMESESAVLLSSRPHPSRSSALSEWPSRRTGREQRVIRSDSALLFRYPTRRKETSDEAVANVWAPPVAPVGSLMPQKLT